MASPIYQMPESEQQLWLSLVIRDVRNAATQAAKTLIRGVEVKLMTDDDIIAAWDRDGAPGLPGASGEIGRSFNEWLRKFTRG